jgi:hypothetical protein
VVVTLGSEAVSELSFPNGRSALVAKSEHIRLVVDHILFSRSLLFDHHLSIYGWNAFFTQ